MSKLKWVIVVLVVFMFSSLIANLIETAGEAAKKQEAKQEAKTVDNKTEPAKKKEPTKDQLDTMYDSFSRIVNDSEGVISSVDYKDSGYVYVTVKESVWALADKSEKESFLAGVHQRVKMSMAGANVIKPRDSVLTKFVNESGDVLAEKKLYGDNFKIKR